MNEQNDPLALRPQALAARQRPRNLISQFTSALLRPGQFFHGLLPLGETRQWLAAAFLILVLIGAVAVRQAALSGGASVAPADPSLGGDFGGDFGGGDFGGGDFGGDFGGGDFGGPPPGLPTDGGAPVSASSSITADLTTGLVAASHIVLGWLILAVLLIEVSLFNGRLPQLGMNFQIAIWSSAPLMLMAILQLLYYSAGGMPGGAGLSGLLPEIQGLTEQPPLIQALALSLASNFTLFWLWSLVLVYFGARFALRGKRLAALIVVLFWVVVQVLVPVLTGAIPLPEAAPIEDACYLPSAENPDATDCGVPLEDSGNPELPSDLNLPGMPGMDFGGNNNSDRPESEPTVAPTGRGQKG